MTTTVSFRDGVADLPGSLRDKTPAELLEDPDIDWDAPKPTTAAGPPAVGVGAGRAAGRVAKPGATATRAAKARAKEQFRRGRSPYGAKNQPRDNRGQFREVLARLKIDLGESELNDVVTRVEQAEAAERDGDYGKSADAATDVVQMVDRLEAGSVNNEQLKNIKDTTRELGRTIAYLPLPQGDENATLRFSDLPPTTQQLLDGMTQRIKDKLAPDKAAELLDKLNAFTSGQVQLTSDELQSELATLLRYLID